ncbi:MAG: hypothetical protein AMJ81_07130 [Phycisphaerae bacterium SM23_33]|jgi:hypothetical protein|nr:MAG: hypothetical protein AMJ81_07130 [Phycisphaerae bacterium SM23_33]
MPPKVSVKPDFPEAKQRVEAWWAGSSLGRPAVSCRLPRPGAPPPPGDGRPPGEHQLDPQWQLAQAEWMLAAQDFPADTMPGFFPQFASNLMIPAALAGGELEYHPDTTWVRHDPDIYRRELPASAGEHRVFRALDAALRLVAGRLGDELLLSAPPLLDGLTTLSVFRDPQQLCLDLLERPEDVQRVTRRLNELALAAHRAFFSTLQQLGHAQTVTWCDLYAPGRAEMVQCDFSIMLSPVMYQEFVMPQLRMLTEYMEYSCYHMDGTPQTRFLEQLCSLPRLQAIQWNPEPPAPPPLEWLDFFREVRRRRRSLWIACDADTAEALTRQLGPDGLMLSVQGVDRPDKLERLLRRLAAAVK